MRVSFLFQFRIPNEQIIVKKKEEKKSRSHAINSI